MGIIGYAIKNAINKTDKYVQGQEKIAQVLDIDKSTNLCTVSIINRDGAAETVYEVPVKKGYPGLTQWRPAAGDLVEVEEKNKQLMIVAKFNENVISDNRKIEDDNYTSIFNGIFGGFTGL